MTAHEQALKIESTKPAPQGDAEARLGAALSDPAAKLDKTDNQPASSNASAYLPECNLVEFMKTSGRFVSLDTDRDNFITKEELNEALKKGSFTNSEKITLRYMARAVSDIEEASNDEPFDERSGITRADIAAFKPFEPTLKQRWGSDPFDKDQFHLWSDLLADKLGIKDSAGEEMTNAFRHVLTSTIYALKYGGAMTYTAGEVNEFQRNIRSYFTESGNHWWKDSRADTFNNTQGIAIAKQLQQEAARTGRAVTVDDAVRAAHNALLNGKVITNVNSGANQFGRVLQKP